MAHLVQAGAHHLRLAAQAVRVLNFVAIKVRLAHRAACEPRAVGGRHIALAALTACGVDAVIKRRVCALGGIDRHRTNCNSGIEHTLQALQGVKGERRRTLRSVEQRQALFRAEHEWREARVRKRLRSRHARAVDEGLAHPDQHTRHVGERRQIARGADRAFLGDHRQHIGIEQREQRIDHFTAHRRDAVRQARGLQQQHQPNHRGSKWLADAGAV